MKAYGTTEPKFEIGNYRHSGLPGTAKAFTKSFKEEIRNANRSRKKTERQRIKLELREFM